MGMPRHPSTKPTKAAAHGMPWHPPRPAMACLGTPQGKPRHTPRQAKLLGQFLVWCERHVLHAPQEYCKSIKIEWPFQRSHSNAKVSFERKICSIHKIFSLFLYLGYESIYRQRAGVKPELGLILTLKLWVHGVWFSLGVYPHSTETWTVD